MPPILALLCPPEDARHLGAILATANRDLVVVTAADAAGLERTVAEAGGVDRIVAFRTNSIVPAELLRRVPGPSYNFHPAPPGYPGRYPFAFALYDGAMQYGVTAHEMVEQVDAGPIVGALGFPLPTPPDPDRLTDRTHTALVQLFVMLAAQLAQTDRPLPRTSLNWDQSRRCTRKALDALRALPPDIGSEEMERRIRALRSVRHEGIRPHLTLHGRRFALEED
ncbi:formyltransferase family protein [Azospirillum sp. B21]|uniref:formyltransferase family protein n=1 Tax=Azospirillum sp. B21 TaxID=2607496 RepID=UPI00165F0D8D|nr:formyltransferase family protein [Azospirillum sp. B21]